MFKKILLLLAFLLPAIALAQSGKGYQTLPKPIPTANPNKVEVIEFFWYGCPHCYSLEPDLNQWLKTIPDNVDFIRIPTIYSSLWEKHAKAFIVAQTLGVADRTHADFFDTIQNKKQPLTDEDDLAQFFVEHGVEDAKFRSVFSSFLVNYKVKQTKALTLRYNIQGVPAIIINGKYLTNAKLAGSNKDIIGVIDKLIAQETLIIQETKVKDLKAD